MALKKILSLAVAVTVAVSLLAPAAGLCQEGEPSGEDIIVDFAVLRPAGLVALGAGTIIYVISFPFAAITGDTKTPAKKLVVEPYEFTFGRPLGANMNGDGKDYR